MLKEEIGRGLESSINDQTDSEDIIYRYTGKYVDDAANTFKGSSTNTETAADSVAFLKKGNVEHNVEVDDPDAAHVRFWSVVAYGAGGM